MPIRVKLGDIADISMGQSFSARLEPEEHGEVRVIQMKDLGRFGELNTAGAVKVSPSGIRESNIIKQGDLIFRSRGRTNTGVMVADELDATVVAAPLYRIRVQDERALPEYLLWVINLPATQVWFTSRARGTAVKIISRQSVAELEIDLPQLDLQRTIVELANLEALEQQLMAELAGKRKQYMEGILMRYASESQ